MKQLFFPILIFITASLLFKNTITAQTNNSPQSFFKHTVIITFKQDAPADSIKALDDIYTGLSKSSFVKDFELGVNISTRDSGIVKHVYVTTFVSKEDMKSYSKIPEYTRLFKISLPISEDVTVVDYWIRK